MVYLCLSCLVTSFISCNMKINAVLFSVYFKILISILKILTDIFRLKQCVTSHRSDLFFTAMSKNFLASLCSPYLLKSNNHRHNFFMKIPTKCKFQKHVITLKYQGLFEVQCNVLFMSVFGVELPVKNEHFWALFNFSIIFFCLASLGILFL